MTEVLYEVKNEGGRGWKPNYVGTFRVWALLYGKSEAIERLSR